MQKRRTIPPELVEEARLLGGHETDEDAVIAALEAYVRRLQQTLILDDFGTIDYDPEYDH